MMLLSSIILGIVQGLTEFLPVSSSAHLVLVPFFFNWEDQGLAYDVALHMGTLTAILLYYRRDWAALLKQFMRPSKMNLNDPSVEGGLCHWKWIVIGTVPAAVLGLLFEKQVESTFRSPITIAATLVLFGVLLIYWDKRGTKLREIATVRMPDALLIGFAQAMAIFPGVSRSGATITAGLILGLNRPSAVRFSFLLSAPIIAGAGVLKSKHIYHALMAGGDAAASIIAGFVASFVAGLGAIQFLSVLSKSTSFKGFGYYRIGLALVIIVVIILR